MMKRFLENLNLSINHLQIIDKIFSEFDHPQKERYRDARKKIKNIDEKWIIEDISPSDQLYIGGKKEKKYSRTMILSDIFEYMITGRFYYFFLADKDDPNYKEKKSDFFKIILLIINQLMIWDSMTVEKDLRDQVLKELKNKIPEEKFFKDKEQKDNHNLLEKIEEDIGLITEQKDLPSINGDKELRKKISDYYDSLLPKTAQGLWNELITYIYMLKTNIGYILPLLLTQRIYSINETLKPPDFIIIDYNNKLKSIFISKEERIENLHEEKLIGVEVGGGKELQSGSFSGETRQPALTVRSESIPPRCPICGKWILFCEKVIKDFSDIENPITFCKDHIKCLYHCDIYTPEEIFNGECPDVQYNGKISKESKKKLKTKISYNKNYHHHLSCVRKINDKKAEEMIDKAWSQYKNALKKEEHRFNITPKYKYNSFVSNYPYVRGLEILEMYNNRNKMFCFGDYHSMKDKRNCKFGYCNFNEKCKLVSDFIKFQKETNNFENKKETIDKYF